MRKRTIAAEAVARATDPAGDGTSIEKRLPLER
jgi:hypothetical protein